VRSDQEQPRPSRHLADRTAAPLTGQDDKVVRSIFAEELLVRLPALHVAEAGEGEERLHRDAESTAERRRVDAAGRAQHQSVDGLRSRAHPVQQQLLVLLDAHNGAAAALFGPAAAAAARHGLHRVREQELLLAQGTSRKKIAHHVKQLQTNVHLRSQRVLADHTRLGQVCKKKKQTTEKIGK